MVSSNHSIRKGAIYTALIKEYDSEKATNLCLTPYISFKEKSSLSSMTYLASIYSPRELRAFLITHLNWQVQNSYADLLLFKWITRTLSATPDTFIDSSSITLDVIMKFLRGHQLKITFSKINKKIHLQSEDQALLRIIKS